MQDGGCWGLRRGQPGPACAPRAPPTPQQPGPPGYWVSIPQAPGRRGGLSTKQPRPTTWILLDSVRQAREAGGPVLGGEGGN